MNYNKIKAKAILKLPLTKKEEAIYLLFIASNEQFIEYLNHRNSITATI